MKSIINSLALFFLIAISACDPSNTVLFIVDNQTDESFELRYYMTDELEEQLEIPEKSSVTVFESSAISPELPDWNAFDSITLVSPNFQFVYKASDQNKSFYDYDDWEQTTETTKRRGSTDRFTFSITEGDLQ